MILDLFNLMFLHLREAVEKIKKNRNQVVEIVSHMDADGVCAAAIISKTLERENIEHKVRFLKMLYREVVEKISPAEFTIFTDLGSSQLYNLEQWRGREVIICDHHPPHSKEGWDGLSHLNAHLFGLNGTEEISGSGMTYLLARMFGYHDLSKLALLGALGDAQNVWGRLKGYNRRILEEAKKHGVEVGEDLLLFGRFSRPLFKSLMGFSDPFIPGLSGSIVGAVSLLKELEIPQRNDKGEWRRVADLSMEEKRKLANALIERALKYVPPELSSFVPNLVWGEVYNLPAETEILRDASEFSTCLNSTARHEQPEIGFELAKGDRGPYYRAMLQLLREYRKFLSRALDVLQREGVKSGPKGRIQYFDLTGVIKETFVGTLAGLCLSSGLCDPYKPVIGMVRDAGLVRISARCSKLLFLKGLNLAEAVRKAAEAAGGEGGGHAVACGAQVPEEKLDYFMQELETQLGGFSFGG
jgi:RecJ-like exonuclease